MWSSTLASQLFGSSGVLGELVELFQLDGWFVVLGNAGPLSNDVPPPEYEYDDDEEEEDDDEDDDDRPPEYD
jgi:hypothetical protein